MQFIYSIVLQTFRPIFLSPFVTILSMGFPVSGVFTVWSRDKVSATGQFAGEVSRRQILQTEAAVNRETEYEESEPGIHAKREDLKAKGQAQLYESYEGNLKVPM